MQKICAIILLSALVSNCEPLPQNKWSRPIRNPQGQLTRERRQFPFGEWIPLNQACPTCRPFADPLDSGFRGESIGLTPPRPPTVTRQIHNEGNFFPQDESSILSVPPPPPSAIPRHPITNSNGNFQFSNFGQQFNSPLPVPTQQIFPQTQQVQFLSQPFLSNQQLLVNNGNQQVLSGLNNANNIFVQENQGKQQIINGKVTSQKGPENVVLEQNKRPNVNKPAPFTLPQQQTFVNQQQQQVQQVFNGQQQGFRGQQQQQQQHSVNFQDAILTPPPAPTNVSQNIVIPGLDKEEIQLLYVPVETLRQRGNFQGQLLTQQPQNIQFSSGPIVSQRPPSSLRPTEQTTTTIPKGHFVTQGEGGQSLNNVKLTSSQSFPTSATPSPLLLQSLPFSQTPQPFVSATPSTPQFVTTASVSQKLSPFTPETTLPQISTIANTIQFGQSDLNFGTTPKPQPSQEAFQEQIINGKTQFSSFQNVNQKQSPRPQGFITQQQQQNLVKENQKELEIQNQISNQQVVEQEQIALQKQEEQRLLQQQKEKELQEQYLLKQRQQKELEAQRLLQQQRQLEEQRLLQQQKQKELEAQLALQQQKLKELEEQRLLQQQKQKELERQRFLQQQQEKELENQRRLQAQRQKELEEKRRIQLIKQKEEEQLRLIRFQQQQKELEEQRIRQQQEEQQRLLLERQKQENLKRQQEEQRLLLERQKQENLKRQQEEQQRLLLERQKQENLKKQQQFQFLQQQQQQQVFQQQNRHKLPANDNLNSISQLEKESEPESNLNLVPHQPPLSVFYKGFPGAEAKIGDVLRELRSSRTITVLDQYFEKMPKVFVGPAGLIPPAGYGKFELPYLSNIESNLIERNIDRLPFFVAPLNFVPPPGYAKIPFPAPHVGSVVVSSESNPAMTLKETDRPEEDKGSEGFQVVGPELPGLINGLETETTTVKPVTLSSTPSLPQTTAQLRNRRPNIYRTQSRKPVAKSRPQTTSKPEEEVTQAIPKFESNREPESGLRKPFNRFLNRRRQQSKTTTESSVQTDSKNLENRHYSVEVYHQQKNQLPRQQQKSDFILSQNGQLGSIDRSTPGGHGVFEVSSTPGLLNIQPTGGAAENEGNRPSYSDYSDNLQTFEDGPLPTGSAKTITQELYRPNTIRTEQQQYSDVTLSKLQPKQESSQSEETFQYSSYEEQGGSGVQANPVFVSSTARNEEFSVQPTQETNQEQHKSPVSTSETYSERTENSYSPEPVTVSDERYTKGFADEQYTSAFAEISKHHHFPAPVETSKTNAAPTPGISINLQAPFSQEQHSKEVETSGEARPTQISDYYNQQYVPTGSSSNQYSIGGSDPSVSQITPTAAVEPQEQYQNSFSTEKHPEEERRPSFISFQEPLTTVESPASPQSYFPSSTIAAIQEHIKTTEGNENAYDVSPKQTDKAEDSIQVVNQQTTEVHGQDVNDDSLSSHRQRLPNPSIVRVRTRVRGKSRGQVNFAASQSTTQTPFIRSRVENKNNENAEQEYATKANYQPVKTSKYNQYRGLKKPLRTTTAEPVTESEYKGNVYTIRPPRRPSNPSTVSTKRIRKPTTPVSTVESATEAYGLSTYRTYTRTEESDFAPSGVSNDVYYEHTSLSPVRQKFRQGFGAVEQKSDVVAGYGSTGPYEYEAASVVKEQTESVSVPPDGYSVSYPEWNPSESGLDVSGIVLTTAGPSDYDIQSESEEPKKSQDAKKAFDPDLEKKSGRRRVRVRVHKRPHENFETAESQNLRTVANVLVPPTSTYKPNDENSFHQLAKNADFSFAGQKLFGHRSREYFRKRLNLTEASEGNEEHQPTPTAAGDESTQKLTGKRVLTLVRKTPKAEKNDHESTSEQSSEVNFAANDGDKVIRPKHRGYVRKIIKHRGGSKEVKTDSTEESEANNEHQELQQRKVEGGIGRANSTRHRTLVKFVKKHKIRPHNLEVTSEETHPQETVEEAHQEKTSEEIHQETISEEPHLEKTSEGTLQSGVQAIHQTTDSATTVDPHQTESQVSTEKEVTEQRYPVYQTPELPEPVEPQTKKAEQEVKEETISSTPAQTTTTQKAKLYQNLRPAFQRPTYTGFQRTREPTSTTEHVEETSEKRNGSFRPKYGKGTTFGTGGEEVKRTNEYQSEQQKNKNLHTLEVRKYLRTKSREGAFSQFSKNRYYTSEKIETTQGHESEEREEVEKEETTTPVEKVTKVETVETTSVESKPQTTIANEENVQTTKIDEPELQATTETFEESTEESSEEESNESESEEPEVTDPALETTTEVPTTFQTPKTTEEKSESQYTETQPDIYSFVKNTFSFEAEKFTGTKNRAHVRNITADVIENTASFSAPGIEKHVVSEVLPTTTATNEKTEETTTKYTTGDAVATTTEYPETVEPETDTTPPAEPVTKAKVAKLVKTSTTTKISHETEICYKGKCIRTKSENPDEDLKLLVDSANIMKIEKPKT